MSADLDDLREHITRMEVQLEAWIAEADPNHVHRWITVACGGNHPRTVLRDRWSGGTVGYDNECACGARVHLGC